MSNFTVKRNYRSGKPASDVGVMIDYGWLHVHKMGNHTFYDGKSHSFTS